MRIAVLISGRGSNFKAIHEATLSGKIKNSSVVLVLSSRANAAGLTYALNNGLNAKFVDPKAFISNAAFDEAVLSELEASGADIVCLAGYMRIVSQVLIDRFYGRIINIHPSLLPAFPGLDAQKQALTHGVKVSGCTVHFVDNGVDTGPIIAQRAIELTENDTVESLSKRILEQEHRLYPHVLSLFEQGKVRLEGRKVFINL